ncbi:hypothetical protein CBR_g31714 [Chara braunii]|uniref:Gfo/Idh/MocA-like oxidoreductase N-terminal domain-containing protein n=1 Tax=Chara braunii TaxID=69332 RepID=A0A388JY44_CHABU|nr:hypothetical protein CBR_g31714 [Chara braunii]|eukprot:GBG62697.1 hypothetical protein CBR_g31714 [Chara braunii]
MESVDVLMIGAGEYTTGFVRGQHGAASDKPAGVIAVTLIDLRRRGLVNRLALCNSTGLEFKPIREQLRTKIADVYKNMDVSLATFPPDDVELDPLAYQAAIKTMKKGDAVTIFTPDDTHFDMAMAAIESGLHVLLAKPAVKTLDQHRRLCEAARSRSVLVAVEYHKRFDIVYADAKERIRSELGGFSFFSSTMTQPKKQLHTFAGWAGKSSDISYYLNSHHIDVHAWAVGEESRPEEVVAMASDGVANRMIDREVEDTITLMVQWRSKDGSKGTALYTASWISPLGDCHTQQYFHYMGQKGELRVDQAHRGYTHAMDGHGFSSLNPLYMRYKPDAKGFFAGQMGYGYRSVEKFVETVRDLNSGKKSFADVEDEGVLATIHGGMKVTAILEAGRVSLDNSGRPVAIHYDDEGAPIAVSVC